MGGTGGEHDHEAGPSTAPQPAGPSVAPPESAPADMYGSDHDVFFIDVDDEDGEEPVPHNKFRNINIEGSQSGKKPHEAAKTIERRTVRKGMCAMVKGDSSATPLLVLINEVYELHKDDEHKKGEQKKQGAKMVNITWLNRWSEVPADCHWTDSARRAEKLSVDKKGAQDRQRRQVFLTGHKDDIPVACIMHPCQVFFLDSAPGQPCKRLDIQDRAVLRPWPGFICRHFYSPEMQEVYSLDEDGVYTDDECFDIETLLTDTKTFMTQLDIVLGDPEEAPSLKTPAQLEQDKLSRAAEKLAELIDAGSFAGGTTAARKEKLAACETPITILRASVDTKGLRGKFESRWAKARKIKDKEAIKMLTREAKAALKESARPSTSACRKLALSLSKQGADSAVCRLLHRRDFSVVLMVWTGTMEYLIEEQATCKAADYELLHSLLLCMERVPQSMDDLDWVVAIPGLGKVVQRLTKWEIWLAKQLEKARNSPDYGSLHLLMRNIFETAKVVLEMMRDITNEAPAPSAPPAPKGPTPGAEPSGARQEAAAQRPGAAGNASAAGTVPARAPLTAPPPAPAVPAPPVAVVPPHVPVPPPPSAPAPVERIPGKAHQKIQAKKRTKIAGDLRLQAPQGVSRPAVAPPDTEPPPKRQATPRAQTRSNITGVEWDDHSQTFVVRYTPQGQAESVYVGRRTSLETAMELLGESIRVDANKLAGGDPVLFRAKKKAIWAALRGSGGGSGVNKSSKGTQPERGADAKGSIVEPGRAGASEDDVPLVILASQEGPAHESGNGDEKDPPPPLNRSANPRLKVKAKDKHDKFVHAEYDVKLEEVFVNGKGMTPKQWLNSIGVGRNQTPKSTQDKIIVELEEERSLHDYLLEACSECKSPLDEDHLMLCDGCNYLWHTYCLKPPLDAVPEDAFFCLECSKAQKRESHQSFKTPQLVDDTQLQLE
eukprot:jgi/Tetstr1/424404/TSEL_014962.t1